MNGTIEHLNQKGFAFVARDDGRGQVFLHANNVENVLFNNLVIGDRVSFDIQVDPETGRSKAVKARVEVRS